jgi:hypothetical protein
VVDRTRGIVLEWVDRGGGVKKKGNGRDGWGANNGGVGVGEWGEQLERVG